MKKTIAKTILPLVYCQKNELTVETQLDLNRKNELWGIQLHSGALLALKCTAWIKNWQTAKTLAEQLTCNGKSASLPPEDLLSAHWDKNEAADFAKTVAFLQENGIAADSYRGYICCSDKTTPGAPCFFSLIAGQPSWVDHGIKDVGRIAVVF